MASSPPAAAAEAAGAGCQAAPSRNRGEPENVAFDKAERDAQAVSRPTVTPLVSNPQADHVSAAGRNATHMQSPAQPPADSVSAAVPRAFQRDRAEHDASAVSRPSSENTSHRQVATHSVVRNRSSWLQGMQTREAQDECRLSTSRRRRAITSFAREAQEERVVRHAEWRVRHPSRPYGH